ncbi:MAG: hypothetical protein DDT33_00691 [Firmicutes bacterium]|nr:hypothetical protein [Bacillota bacterium]
MTLSEFEARFGSEKACEEYLYQRRGLLFYRLVQQAVNVDPAPYSAIVEQGRVPD